MSLISLFSPALFGRIDPGPMRRRRWVVNFSLGISVLYLGVAARGLKTGRHRALAAALFALAGLCHLIPALFAVVGTVVMVGLHFRRTSLRWVLTVAPGAVGSHRRRGWEDVTSAVITALAARHTPLVSLLWGREAQKLAPLLAGTAVIESVHPSPLSASRGFFGSRPFSRINELLQQQGAAPIDWQLPMN